MCSKAKAQLNYTTYSYLQDVDGWGWGLSYQLQNIHTSYDKVKLLCRTYFRGTCKTEQRIKGF
jgi:hypothetical protein